MGREGNRKDSGNRTLSSGGDSRMLFERLVGKMGPWVGDEKKELALKFPQSFILDIFDTSIPFSGSHMGVCCPGGDKGKVA